MANNAVTVTYGVGNAITNTSLVGLRLGDVRNSSQISVLGIPSNANYYVNGSAINDDYVLRAGDRVTAESRAASKAA